MSRRSPALGDIPVAGDPKESAATVEQTPEAPPESAPAKKPAARPRRAAAKRAAPAKKPAAADEAAAPGPAPSAGEGKPGAGLYAALIANGGDAPRTLAAAGIKYPPGFRALNVHLPTGLAAALDEATSRTGNPKREVVTALLTAYLADLDIEVPGIG